MTVYTDGLRDPLLIKLIIKLAINGNKVCVIMSGPPGSGKTTIATQLIKDLKKIRINAVRFSTDDYFGIGTNYKFNKYALGHNHAKCLLAFKKSNIRVKIVDNTNLANYESKKYRIHAYNNGYINIMLYLKEFSTDILHSRNIHGVTKSGIERMLKKWR